MAFTQMNFNPPEGLLNTASYPTQPESETAARAQVMEPSVQLKDYINNTLLVQLQSSEQEASGAAGIGSGAIEGVTGTSVQAKLASLKTLINNIAITATGLSDGVVATQYLSNLAVTADKLATDAVETVKIRDGAVATVKIADGAVTAFKFSAAFTGVVFPYAGGTAPEGFLLCDGSSVSRATYSTLFAVIGTAYGAGDGSTTFNLPNLRGRVIAGCNAGDADFNAAGKTGGEKAHTLTIGEIPSSVWANVAGGFNNTPSGTGYYYGSGGGGAHNNLQPYLVMNYIIKY